MNKQHLVRTLCIHLDRSQKAYSSYLDAKNYFRALQIYYPNRTVAELLKTNLGMFEKQEGQMLISWLDHLEAWMIQFRTHEKQINPKLDTEFVFDRIDGAPAFPAGLKEFLNSMEIQEL